jgi:uncharacterized damage-inducible protein DinB
MKEILTQTKILLSNIETTLNGIEENYFNDKSVFHWTIGEQMYHLLSSLDKWFMNPAAESNKESNIYTPNEDDLSKDCLINYFSAIKKKIYNYLENLSDNELNEKPEECPYIRLELVMGQLRHAMYHIGFLHACIRIKFGSAPKYIGLDTFLDNDK